MNDMHPSYGPTATGTHDRLRRWLILGCAVVYFIALAAMIVISMESPLRAVTAASYSLIAYVATASTCLIAMSCFARFVPASVISKETQS